MDKNPTSPWLLVLDSLGPVADRMALDEAIRKDTENAFLQSVNENKPWEREVLGNRYYQNVLGVAKTPLAEGSVMCINEGEWFEHGVENPAGAGIWVVVGEGSLTQSTPPRRLKPGDVAVIFPRETQRLEPAPKSGPLKIVVIYIGDTPAGKLARQERQKDEGLDLSTGWSMCAWGCVMS